MTTQTAPGVGQIWKEADPRLERFVKIVGIYPHMLRRSIAIRTVRKTDGEWEEGRLSYADQNRFHGKRGGYAYVEG